MKCEKHAESTTALTKYFENIFARGKAWNAYLAVITKIKNPSFHFLIGPEIKILNKKTIISLKYHSHALPR